MSVSIVALPYSHLGFVVSPFGAERRRSNNPVTMTANFSRDMVAIVRTNA